MANTNFANILPNRHLLHEMQGGVANFPKVTNKG